MADHARVESGFKPWAPGAGTEVVEVLHRFGPPLVTVIQQHMAHFVAWCVLGQAEPVSLWVYALIDDQDVAPLIETRSLEERAGLLRRVTAHAGNVAALAVEERGILVSTSFEPAMTYGDPPMAALEAIGGLIRASEDGLEALRAAVLVG